MANIYRNIKYTKKNKVFLYHELYTFSKINLPFRYAWICLPYTSYNLLGQDIFYILYYVTSKKGFGGEKKKLTKNIYVYITCDNFLKGENSAESSF